MNYLYMPLRIDMELSNVLLPEVREESSEMPVMHAGSRILLEHSASLNFSSSR